ncbi:MAG TPA: MipA/OmpV family protein [Spongiibacteraceae bacterium]|jgi:outer membrane protein|nr:MipA/OmpV family protein [Spongiibacteraceae bacterium]HUH37117.1 MipA/OmpV family protein [Spongiibacteraceae bacterium]
MKKPGKWLAASLTGLLLPSAVTGALAADIAVRLETAPASGTIVVALFNSANTFGDIRDPTRLETYTLDGSDAYVLKDVSPGEYALMVYLDENGNRKIDKNFIGIPTESLGFSNNYTPKGPPSYARAVFILAQDEQREFTVALYRPLGTRGRIGLGVGAIGRGSPYRDYDGGVTQVIPAITYNGSRLQVLGPNVSFGLFGTGNLRLAASGKYRPGVYEEGDSEYLRGMGDRSSTFLAGIALEAQLPAGFGMTLSYRHDVLGRIGGGEARVAIDKSFQWRTLRFSPEVGLTWLSQDLAEHDFGVPLQRATSVRPAYRLNSTSTVDVGMGVLYEITTDWLVVMNVAVEFFGDDVVDSPIVDENYVINGFFAINYIF